eukprot:CAMPEP_0204824764 /NCGR_PEP_ID=MMETSP1346-20131115/2754_1 /ASSEMBLY_ACC=CAM_ASM_000771 /TAXON_ID=215587 /ORGANISM="Aplanochytrium stocchinoi, Strain GSBS06" /LENGTH=272 /DNA_ID=CAMNT_0051952097 /DNA_START=540 /DNA_END=1355 /DNA_ORIENTATION=+
MSRVGHASLDDDEIASRASTNAKNNIQLLRLPSLAEVLDNTDENSAFDQSATAVSGQSHVVVNAGGSSEQQPVLHDRGDSNFENELTGANVSNVDQGAEHFETALVHNIEEETGINRPVGFVFNEFFDVSGIRLKHVFEVVDTDKDGKVSYDELRTGLLKHTGMRIESDKSFDTLVRMLDTDRSGDISFTEFEEGMRFLKMQLLFQPVGVVGNLEPGVQAVSNLVSQFEGSQEKVPIHVVDYDSFTVEKKTLVTEQQIKEFMFSKDQTCDTW